MFSQSRERGREVAGQSPTAEPPSISPVAAGGASVGAGGRSVVLLAPSPDPTSKENGGLLQSLCTEAVAVLQPLLPWLVALWLAGVAILSTRLALGWLRIERVRRHSPRPADAAWQAALGRMSARLGVTRVVRLVDSALVEVPTVIGWLRPVILLPASAVTGLSATQVEALLAHELAHIRRHDYLVNLLQTAIETLLFYHPAMWWVSLRIRQEREHCCDDLAIAACGDRAAYARALAVMEELRARPPALVAAASGGSLLERIRRIAEKAEPTRRVPAVLPLSILCAVVLLLGSTVRLSVSDEKGPPDRGASRDEPGEPHVVATVTTIDGAPLAGIEAVAYRVDGKLVQRFVTDERGQFQVPAAWWSEPRFGNDQIIVVARDRSGALGWRQIPSSGARSDVDDGDEVGKRPRDRQIELGPTPFRISLFPVDRVVTGRVVGPDNEPLSGVRLQAAELRDERNGNAEFLYFAAAADVPLPAATTDETGAFSVVLPQKCRAGLRVLHPRWLMTGVYPDQHDNVGTIRLQPAGRIAGRVFHAQTGAGAAGVLLDAHGSDFETRHHAGDGYCRSGNEGAFLIGSLQPGRYHIYVRYSDDHPGFVSPMVHNIDVHAGETAKVDIPLQQGRHVVGRVIEKDSGRPVPKVPLHIEVTRVPGRPPLVYFPIVQANVNGEFDFYTVPGFATVDTGWTPQQVSKTPYEWVGESKAKFEVAADADPPPLTLKLGVRAKESPQARTESRIWHILSQPDGIDLLFGMPQRLDKAAEPARRGERAWTGVDGGGSVDLNIEVEGEAAGEILVGFFNDARWWIAEPAQVRAFERPGRYTIDRLPAGTYHIGAMIGSAVNPVALGVDRDWPGGVTVRAGRTTAAELRISRKFQDNISGTGSQIRNGTAGKPRVTDAAKMHTVRIVDQQGRPVPFARVTVVEWQRDNPEQVNFYHEIGGDVDGLAYFDQYPGPLSLMHQRFDFDPASLASRYFLTRRTTRYDSNQAKIELVAADFPAGSGTIRGRVHDQHDKPLDQYFLSLTRTIGERLSNDFATFYCVRLPVTNGDGRFEVRGLPPGTYTAMVRHFDYPTHASTFDGPKVTLPDQPGAVVDADFEIEAKELRYGRLVSSDGQPLARGGYTAWFTRDPRSPWGGTSFSESANPDGTFRVALSAEERGLLEKNSGGKVEVRAYGEKREPVAKTTVRFDQLSPDRQQPADVVLKQQSQRELVLIMVEQLGGHVAFDQNDPNQIVSVLLTSSKVTDDDLKVLSGLTSLKTVSLNWTGVGDAGLAHLKGLTQLESLGLERCANVTDAGLAHIKGLVNLKDLSLPQTKVTDAGMECVKNMTKLTWLDLTGCEITDKGAKLLHGLKDLHVLFFSRRGDVDLRPPLVSVEAVQELRKSLPNCDIQSEPPGDRKAAEAEMRRRAELSQREEEARHQRTAELIRQGFAVESIEQAVAALQQLPAAVGKLADGQTEYVRVRTPRLEGRGQIADVEKFQPGDTIVFVGLGNYPVDDRFLAHLRFLKDLALLDLQKTAITSAGMAHLAGLQSLKTLHVHGTQVGDEGLAHLAGLTRLEELWLLDTPVSDTGLVHLKALTNLADLSLGGTRVSDAGLAQLKGLTELESLDLNGTRVTDAGLAELKGLTKLRNLSLRGTKVTDAGIADLQQALPEAKITYRGPWR